jgi:hypothetical protein
MFWTLEIPLKTGEIIGPLLLPLTLKPEERFDI